MTENPNTNCLEGWKCPECGSFGPFNVVATSTFRLQDAGCVHFEGLDYETDDPVRCLHCDHGGIVATFTEGKKKYSVLLLYPDYLSDGTTTYYHLTEACSPKKAALKAQQAALKALGEAVCDDCEDLLVLLLIEGHHNDLPIYATEIKEV